MVTPKEDCKRFTKNQEMEQIETRVANSEIVEICKLSDKEFSVIKDS